MTTNEMVGLAIAAVVIISGFVAVVLKAVKPINDLNINIVKLTAAIEKLIENDKTQDTRLTNHGEQIDFLKLKAENHETRINALEKRN